MALGELKKEYPVEYEMIQLYYFSDRKITQQEIGQQKSITKQSVNKRLKQACSHLKEYITMYKNPE